LSAPRKLPELEPETAFFWTAGAEGRLKIQRCTACGHYQHPPLPLCPACHSDQVAPAAVSGRGRITSYTINYEPWLPGLEVPFVFAVVELAEQKELYLFTNILAPVDSVRIGQSVLVCFEHHEDVWLPLFRPEEMSDAA
jgi:uncharacterized OB-fold protein